MITMRVLIPYMNMKSRFEAAVSRLKLQGDVKVEFLHVFGIPESLLRHGGAGILVTRGMTYDHLRCLFSERHAVEIQLSSFDILKALICTKQELHPKKVVLCVRHMDDSAVSELEKLCQTEIAYYMVHGKASILKAIYRARAGGADVFVGAGTTYGLCDKESLNQVHIHTKNIAIEQALKQTTGTARTISTEWAESKMTSIILNTSADVSIAVNGSELIRALSNQAYHIFGLSSQADYTGRPVGEVCPALKWKHVVETGRKREEVIQWKDEELYTEYRPVPVDKMEKGAIIVARYTEQIIEAETKIRQNLAKQGPTTKYSFDGIIGDSPVIREGILMIERYNRVDSDVLAVGKTGTGKELFAHSIHRESRHSVEPFVAPNCTALLENLLKGELPGHEPGAFSGASRSDRTDLFGLAHKGTIFLDEIEEIPVSLQAKLLRMLQEREIRHIGSSRVQPVDMRVISAASIDIEEKIREGQLHADLYYRLNLLGITTPPLRERGNDIREMVGFYLTRFAYEVGKLIPRLSREAADLITRYGWLGNVRELCNIYERLIMLSDATEIGLREIQILRIFRKGEDPPPGAETPAKEQVLPETRVMYANLKPRKKKQDITKELGVSRTILWRMEKMAREQKKQ